MRDRGSMTVMTVLVGVAVTAAATVAAVPWLDRLHDRERARSAADAAALAGVVGGREAAERLAAANGGDIVAWSRHGDDLVAEVTVTVRVDGSEATARATNGP